MRKTDTHTHIYIHLPIKSVRAVSGYVSPVARYVKGVERVGKMEKYKSGPACFVSASKRAGKEGV